MENPTKLDDLGGTPSLGNHQSFLKIQAGNGKPKLFVRNIAKKYVELRRTFQCHACFTEDITKTHGQPSTWLLQRNRPKEDHHIIIACSAALVNWIHLSRYSNHLGSVTWKAGSIPPGVEPIFYRRRKSIINCWLSYIICCLYIYISLSLYQFTNTQSMLFVGTFPFDYLFV